MRAMREKALPLLLFGVLLATGIYLLSMVRTVERPRIATPDVIPQDDTVKNSIRNKSDTANNGSVDHMDKYPYLSKGFTKIFGETPIGDWIRDPEQIMEARDSERFQKFLHDLQHPADCNTRFYKMSAHPYGLGSQMQITAMSLLEASVLGLTLIAPWKSRYIAPSRCPSQAWECTFLPLSSCSESDADKQKLRQRGECGSREALNDAKVFEENECLFIERRQSRKGAFQSEWLRKPIMSTLREKAGLEGEYGSLFYIREAVRYVIRPNAMMMNFTKFVRKSIDGLPSNVDMRQVFGAHIRHGEDKMHRAQYDVKDFARYLYHRLESEGRFKYIFLASNSARVHKELPALLDRIAKSQGADFPAPRVIDNMILDGNNLSIGKKSKTYQVVSMPSKFFVSIGTGDRNKDAFTDLAGYDSGESFDEMMALSAQLFILASCGSFVGTLHHNFGQIVWELMSARTYRMLPNRMCYPL